MKTIALCLALVGVGNAQSLLTSQTQECRYVGKDWVCNLYHAPEEFYREKKSTPTHARQSIPATYPDRLDAKPQEDDLILALDTARWSLDYCRANLNGTAWYFNLALHSWRQDDCADFIVKFIWLNLDHPPAKHHTSAPLPHKSRAPKRRRGFH